jgi:F0F1-type ATP synthase membrane subunit b/b'
MKIQLLQSRATATGAENRGQIIEVSDAEAVRMIEAGQAKPVREERKAEKAVKKPSPEKASKG